MGGIRVTVDTEQGVKFDFPRERGTLNLDDLPQFSDPPNSLRDAIAPAILDFGLITFCAIAAFAMAFMVFLRYDVR